MGPPEDMSSKKEAPEPGKEPTTQTTGGKNQTTGGKNQTTGGKKRKTIKRKEHGNKSSKTTK
jgi:hypothetical protein